MSKRSGIMLCAPLEERRLPGTGWINAWDSWPVLVQPKLDGERCRSVDDIDYDAGIDWPCLISSELNPFHSIPHINQAIVDQKVNQLELDGELYVHGMDFPTIHSIVSRTKNLHPDYETMEYHVFDIINNDPQFTRLSQLANLELKPPLKTVPTYVADSFGSVMDFYDQILSQGYEGIIIRKIDNFYTRKRSMEIMKFKPKKDDYYAIIGSIEEFSIGGEPKGRLGALRCIGRDGTPFRVGSGFTDEQRARLWDKKEELPGKLAHVQYQSVNTSGSLRFTVFLEIIEPESDEHSNFLLDL